MPFYEYYCAECHTKFEARRPMREADAAIECQHCESPRTSRVLSLFATIGSRGQSSAQTTSEGFGGCCGGGSCGCRH
jgi:putative FmdB family regulatory protein